MERESCGDQAGFAGDGVMKLSGIYSVPTFDYTKPNMCSKNKCSDPETRIRNTALSETGRTEK